MEILICQGCGVILRGKTKSCQDCGATISKHSPTALPVISHTSAPLAVAVPPDPIVLEKAVSRYQYRNLYTQHTYSHDEGNGSGNGNGNGNGNGGSAAATWGTPHAASVNIAPQQNPTEIDFATGRPIASPDPQPTATNQTGTQSKLGSLLGSAGSLMPGSTGASDVSGLISLDSESLPEPVPALQEKPPIVVSDNSYAVSQEAEPIQPTIDAPADAPSLPAPVPPAFDSPAASPFAEPASQGSATDPLPIGGPIPVGAIPPVGTLPPGGGGIPGSGIPPLAAAASGFAAGAAAAAIAGALFHSGQSSTMADKPDDAASQTPSGQPPSKVASFIAEPASNVALAAATTAPLHSTISVASAPVIPPPSPAAASDAHALGAGPGQSESGAQARQDFFAGGPMGSPPAGGAFLPFGQKRDEASVSSEGKTEPSGATASTDSSAAAEAPKTADEPAAPPGTTTGAASEPAPNVVAAAEAPAPFVAPPTGSFFDSPATGAGGSGDFFSSSSGSSASAASPFFSSSSASSGSQPSPSGGSSAASLDQTASGAQPSIIAEAIARAQRAAREGAEAGAATAPVDKKEKEPVEEYEPIKTKEKLFDDPPKSKVTIKDDDDDDDDEEEEDKKPRKRPRLEDRVADDKTISVFGLPMKMQTVMTAAIVLFMVVAPVLGILSTVFGSLGQSVSGGQQQQQQQPSGGGGGGGFNLFGGGSAAPAVALSGKWETLLSPPKDTPGKPVRGTLTLVQQGDVVQGSGQDKWGLFFVKGSTKTGRLEAVKQYVDDNNQPRDKPITIICNIIPGNDAKAEPPQIKGGYKFTKRVGFGWRGQIRTFVGEFKGYMSQGMDPSVQPMGGGPQIASNPGHVPGNINMENVGKSPKEMHQFFLNVALGIIGVGCVLALLSLKLFGPSGMINIWAKKEYIPSQFKAQHIKMVRELGKPLKPGGLPIGTRVDWNLFSFYLPRQLAIPPDLREQNPHVLLLGGGAKGKSRLMASMVAHDMLSGDRAVVLVDSDGGLVDLLMDWVASHPKGRDMAKRIVIIDPTYGDVDNQIGYNPLEFPDDGDLQNAASAVVFGFKAIYTEPPGSQSQWNQQTANILRNAAILLMANGRTLTDLPTLLAENDFRDVLLEKVERIKNERAEYITLIDAWNNYKRLARTDQWLNWIEPILNRVQPMLGDPRIRPILTKPKGDLSLKDIVIEQQILFVKIPQGQLDQNANLLGSLIVSGLKQAALSLSLKGNSKRRPCALYLDEFDSFIEKETFDALTSETRKFQIGLIAATKTLQGLPEDYRNQVVINTGTMCIFALAKKDGDMLGPQMFRVDGRKVKHQTIQNIFNKVNTSPQFELISDEEKLNIDRVVGQEERTFFCYRVGTVAGVFNMKSPDFKDVVEKDVNRSLLEQIYGNRPKTQKEKDKNKKSKGKELAESTA